MTIDVTKFENIAAKMDDVLAGLTPDTEAWLEDLKHADAPTLARTLRALNSFTASMSALKAWAEINVQIVRESIIPERLEDLGIEKETIAGVGTLYTSADVYVSAIAAMKSELHTWLQDTGGGDLIVPTVNASSLKAFVKGKMKQGEEIPETLVKVTPFRRAAILKK